MKIVDCLPLMSKQYLTRVVDSILKDDVPRGDEDRLREQIRQNATELADRNRILEALRDHTLHRNQRILMGAALTSLLTAVDMCCAEESLFEAVRSHEQGIVDEAADESAFGFSDAHAIEIYREVLAVALEDDDISLDEHRLLEKLRRKLGVSRSEHRLLEAKLGKFPKPGNDLHTLAEFRDALKSLQGIGVVLYCNRAEDGAKAVLPEEVAPAVKQFLGFELSPEAQALLHDALSNEQLREALRAQGLPVSGTKAERGERLAKAGVKPSEVLGTVHVNDLRDLCKKLPGVKVAGSKDERIQRLIDYFGSLTSKEPEPSDDPRAVFCQYLEEFAARDNKNLYQRKLIRHDRDMESGFEEGTRYLFEVKLGCQLVPMLGTDHADGCVEFPNGELLLWDNKGKEAVYTLPKAHADQFKRYIRESAKRVNAFLVIVPAYHPDTRLAAMKLKHETATDTDVALITAEDRLAENWPKHSHSGRFSLEVFNTTGLLDRTALEERMGVLLSRQRLLACCRQRDQMDDQRKSSRKGRRTPPHLRRAVRASKGPPRFRRRPHIPGNLHGEPRFPRTLHPTQNPRNSVCESRQ